MADRRRKKNDIEEAKRSGQKALEDAKAGKIQRVESENEVRGFAEIPYLQGGNSNFGDTSPSVAIDTPTLPTVQQIADISRQLQEENASRNEQRRAERDRRASLPIEKESTSVSMEQAMAGLQGPNVANGTLDRRGTLSENGQKEVNKLTKRIESLQRTPMTGDAAIDEVTQSNNQSAIADLQRQIDSIYETDNSERSANVDRYLDSNRKLSKYEKNEANAIFEEYLNNNPKAKELYNTNDAAMSSLLAQRFTPDEAEEYAKMITLKNKISRGQSAGLHATESMPFVKGLADKSTEKYGERIGRDLSDYDYSSQLEQTQTQNPLESTLGNMAYQVGSYSAFAPLVEGIPVVGKVASSIGNKFNNPVVGEAVSNIVKGQIVDAFLDTLPNEIIPDVMEGNWKSLAKDILLNQFGNLAFNTLGEAGGAVARNLIPSLKSADEVTNSVRRADLDALELAKQNESGINDLAIEREKIMENIQNNLKRLPMKDLDGQEKEIIDQIQRYLRGELKRSDMINMGETPRYLSDFGNVDNDSYLKQKKLKAMLADDYNHNNPHNLTPEQIASFVRDSNSPMAVFESDSVAGRPVIVGNQRDLNDWPIMSVMNMDEPIDRGLANIVASRYGRENMAQKILDARKDGRMLFENREKVDELISRSKQQLPTPDSSSDLLSSPNINQKAESVKNAKKNNRWGNAADRLIPEDSYARTDEFRQLEQQRYDLRNERDRLESDIKALHRELESESTPKPESEWNADDKLLSMMGYTPESYTEKGRIIQDKIDEMRGRVNDLSSQISSIDDSLNYRRAQERLAQLENYQVVGITPATRSDYTGFSTESASGRYDDYVKEGKAVLAEMSPEEYLRRCAYEIFGYDGHETFESMVSSRSQKDIDNLIAEIRKGTKLDAPYLDYRDRGQEGIHRALAAYELGIDKIPVVVRGTPDTISDLGFEARKLIHDADYARSMADIDKKLEELEIDDVDLLDFDEITPDLPSVPTQDLDAIKRVESKDGGDIVPPNGGRDVPTTTPEQPSGDKVSRYATNTMRRGTNLTPEEYAEQDLSQFMYESKTEKQSMEDAFRMIQEEGADNLKERLMAEEAKDLTQSETDALMSLIRTNNATIRALRFEGKLDEANALRAETTAMNKKVRQQASSNAQGLQALAKWTRNTPEGMLMHAENIVNGNVKTEKSALQEALDKLKRSRKDVEFSPEFEDKFLEEAEKLMEIGDMDSREAKDIMAKLGRLVNDQLPVKLNEKIQAYLMDNMLGNFRTLITRNAGGNLGLNAVEQTMTRPLAAGIDRLVSKKTGRRTQAGMTIPALKEYMQGFAKGIADEAHDLKTGLHTARTGENTLNEAIRANRHVFKSKVMDKLDSLVKNGLSVGDRPFYEATYNQTLGDYYRLRSAGVMGNDIQALPDELFDEYAKTAANLNALSAVYQNNSELSNALLKMKDGIGDLSEGMLGFDILSQFSMPFVKTPANVVDRAIDYSPLGIVRNAVRTAKEGGIGGENFDQNRFVNETARNILGTALMGGGAAAAANGVMSGAYSDDADEKRIQKESGIQEYALNLPGGKQMDISWIPVLGSNAVAADAAYNAYKNDEGESKGLALTKGIAEGGQSLFDQSMFQGLQRLFGTGETYNDDDNIVSNMLNVVKQGFGQAIPSLVRQVAQVSDQYQRDLSGSNKDTSFGPFDNYTINSWANNIPGLREAVLNPKVDSQGNLMEESQGRGLASKILEDMILPGKVTQLTSNRLNDEASRLSEITGNETAYLPKANRSKVDTEDHILSNEEYLEYEQRHNKELNKAGEALLNTDLYNEADDQTKESMLSNLYSAISTAINSEYNGKELSGAAKAYAEGGMDAAIDYVQYGGILKQYGLDNNEKNREMAKEGGIEAVQQAAQTKEFADEAGVTSSSKVGGLISDAVASGDTAQAQEIVDSTVTLQSLGLDKPGPAYAYQKVQDAIPGTTVEQFAQTYKSMDADGNQSLKQSEIVDYFNTAHITNEVQGMQLWNAYGNSSWKKIPVLEDGTWRLKAK